MGALAVASYEVRVDGRRRLEKHGRAMDPDQLYRKLAIEGHGRLEAAGRDQCRIRLTEEDVDQCGVAIVGLVKLSKELLRLAMSCFKQGDVEVESAYLGPGDTHASVTKLFAVAAPTVSTIVIAIVGYERAGGVRPHTVRSYPRIFAPSSRRTTLDPPSTSKLYVVCL